MSKDERVKAYLDTYVRHRIKRLQRVADDLQSAYDNGTNLDELVRWAHDHPKSEWAQLAFPYDLS